MTPESPSRTHNVEHVPVFCVGHLLVSVSPQQRVGLERQVGNCSSTNRLGFTENTVHTSIAEQGLSSSRSLVEAIPGPGALGDSSTDFGAGKWEPNMP